MCMYILYFVYTMLRIVATINAYSTIMYNCKERFVTVITWFR